MTIGPKGLFVPVTCVLTGCKFEEADDAVRGVEAGRAGVPFSPEDPKKEGLGARAEADEGPCDCDKDETPVGNEVEELIPVCVGSGGGA